MYTSMEVFMLGYKSLVSYVTEDVTIDLRTTRM